MHDFANIFGQQRLHEIMINEIIPKFAQGDQADLKKAADLWRLPYWVWHSIRLSAIGIL